MKAGDFSKLWQSQFQTGSDDLTDEERVFFRPAPNAIKWATGIDYLGHTTLHEWFGSWMIIRDFFQLRCPTCNPGGPGTVKPRSGGPKDCWGKSREYLEEEVLLEWDPDLMEDVCPKCHTARSAFIDEGLLTPFNQLHLLCGMRSGKSVTAAIIGTYIEHFILCLAHSFKDPKGKTGLHAYFDMPKAIQFEMTVLASSETQSKDTIWALYRGFRADSPWFKRYVPWILNKQTQQRRAGMRAWEYDEEKILEIRNGHPDVRLVINSANSNSAGLAGRTRIAGLVDELGRMKVTDGPSGGDEVYRTVEQSLQTVRSEVLRIGAAPWLGAMISVSSPKSQADKAFRLWRQSPKIPGMLSHRLATWEYNPRQPRKNFDAAYAKDPLGADTDFGANPPGSDHPFIHDPKMFGELAIDPKLKPTALFENYLLKKGKHEYIATRIADMHYRRDRYERFVFCDAGQNFDAFSLACAHGEWVSDGRGNEIWKTVIDWVCRIVPLKRREIYFQSVVDVLQEAKVRQNITRVRFDRWQSVKPIQDIRDLGIEDAEKMSLKPNDYNGFKQDYMEGRVALLPPRPDDTDWKPGDHFEWLKDPPYLSPEAAGLYELLGLQRDPETAKVTNPNKGLDLGFNSDDTAQVLVGVHILTQTAGFTEKFDDRGRRAARARMEDKAPMFERRGSGIIRTQGGSPTAPARRRK